jgi:hypothetical protein
MRSRDWRLFATIEEIAVAEKINASYVGRVPRLTLLAPARVKSILDARHPAEMTLAVLMRPVAEGEERLGDGVKSCPPHHGAQVPLNNHILSC